jgi:hypothetical protein
MIKVLKKLIFLEFKNSDSEGLESKATKATRALPSEKSQNLASRVASFTERDMDKILSNINKNKTPTNGHSKNWKKDAQKQIQGIKVFKKKTNKK